MGLTLMGCAAPPGAAAKAPAVSIDPAGLANSPPIQPELQWQARVPLGSEPVADSLCRLCDQYDLVEIRTPSKWKAFCRQTGMTHVEPTPDFNEGSVVGLVARVGEPVDGNWPTTISELRLLANGTGWLRTQFRTGLYRPLLVDAYCNLIYVKSLRRVVLVEVNRRAFLTGE